MDSYVGSPRRPLASTASENNRVFCVCCRLSWMGGYARPTARYARRPTAIIESQGSNSLPDWSMSVPILNTKLYIPPPQPGVVLRPRLMKRLDEGMHRRLILVCAPAGFGKTTLLSQWVITLPRPAAWLSLDEGDNDPVRFLAYLVATLRTISPNIGEGVLGVLQSPQPAPTESIMTNLLAMGEREGVEEPASLLESGTGCCWAT
jgi:hypothetical protein